MSSSFNLAEFLYHPHRGDPEPIIAVLYEKHENRWRVDYVVTPITDYGFTHCVEGQEYYSSHTGNIDYLKESKTLDLPKWEWPEGTPPAPMKLWVHPGYISAISNQPAHCEIIKNPLKLRSYGDFFNPINSASNEDSEGHPEYCTICKGYWPSDDHCCHLRYQEGAGMTLGCGSPEVDVDEAKQSVFDLLDILPPSRVRHLYDMFRAGSFDLHCRADWPTRIEFQAGFGRKIGKGKKEPAYHWPWEVDDDSLEEEPDTEGRYWPGLAWLASLTKGDECQGPMSLTLGWFWEYLHASHNAGCVLPLRTLHLELTPKEFEKWFRLDPNQPKLLHDYRLTWRKSALKSNRSANTLRFQRDPEGTLKVSLSCRRKQDYRRLTLRLHTVEQNAKDYRFQFSRILDHNGKHPSTLPGYTLCDVP